MNLLLTALSAIRPSVGVKYLQALGGVENAAGYVESTFAPPVAVRQSSVQAVPRDKYEFMGLELSKNYVNWYVPQAVIGLERDSSGDRLIVGTRTYQVVSTTDWDDYDGWAAALCVRIDE